MGTNNVSIETLLALDETRLQRAAIKLTHVGEQTEPVATLVIQSYHYLPALENFKSWQTAGLSYANDELPLIFNFSVSPPELKRVLEAAKQVSASTSGQASLSFTAVVDEPEGIQGTEVLFNYESGVELYRQLATAIDADNKIGQTVLRMSAYATGG